MNALLPNVKNIIAVASGKGGVGKSTVALNLALSLARKGSRVGLLDADIYGPSVPKMVGIEGQKPDTQDGKIIPLMAHGLKIMSIGFLIAENSPLIWRGVMVHKAMMQMLGGVDWGELDFLVVDMPPGTGDAHLTLVQKSRPNGAVVVSTPQDLSLLDAKKAIGMFDRTGVPILGIIENMSGFECPSCGEVSNPFGAGSVEKEAEESKKPFLGRVPLDINIRQAGDSGAPVVMSSPDSKAACVFLSAAEFIRKTLC